MNTSAMLLPSRDSGRRKLASFRENPPAVRTYGLFIPRAFVPGPELFAEVRGSSARGDGTRRCAERVHGRVGARRTPSRSVRRPSPPPARRTSNRLDALALE